MLEGTDRDTHRLPQLRRRTCHRLRIATKLPEREPARCPIRLPVQINPIPTLEAYVSELSEDSPLWMVSRAPGLNALVAALQRHRAAMDAGAGSERLCFSRAQLAQARAEFGEMIRHGERDLHLLAGLLSERLLGAVQRRSVVIGEVERTHERFTLAVDVTEAEVVGSTDLDLGNRVLARLAITDQRGWLRAHLVRTVGWALCPPP